MLCGESRRGVCEVVVCCVSGDLDEELRVSKLRAGVPIQMLHNFDVMSCEAGNVWFGKPRTVRMRAAASGILEDEARTARSVRCPPVQCSKLSLQG